MPFDGRDQKIVALEQLCRVLENTSSFSIQMHVWDSSGPHPCGTPACILGHAWDLWPETCSSKRSIIACNRVADKIGVDQRKFEKLCYKWILCGGGLGTRITGRIAAEALRRLHRTGEARYDLKDT